MNTHCVIAGGGEGFNKSAFANAACIICADSGFDACLNAGITPNCVIGDFDSSNSANNRFKHNGIRFITLQKEKDVTDLQAAIDEGFNLGYVNFILTGVSGGRADHFLSAAYMLEYIALKSGQGEITDGRNLIYYHGGGERVFPLKSGYKYLSVLPLDKEITGVTLSGLKYPLINATLKREHSLGVSNEFADKEAVIKTEKGAAFIIYSTFS